MTTETKTVTLETLYAEILELKTLLRDRAAAPAASATKPKKAKAASAVAEPAEPKAPSTNPWILFTKRVETLIRAKEEADGVAKEAKMKTVVAKQFASDLKGRKPYAEWADEEIVAALDGWAPPAVSKQAAEGKTKEKKPAAEKPAAEKKPRAKKEKPAAAPSAAAAVKKLDLRFYSWAHGGEDYFTNERGDVVTTEFEWVGRFNGETIDESAPEPADLANAEMRE